MPSTGKHPNSFAIHSARSLHWSIFVSERDSSCCHRFGFGGDLVRLVLTIPRKRARRHIEEQGRRVKGPEMVTVKEFNQWSGADGISFLTTEVETIALDSALVGE
jgi:hypothetical protein